MEPIHISAEMSFMNDTQVKLLEAIQAHHMAAKSEAAHWGRWLLASLLLAHGGLAYAVGSTSSGLSTLAESGALWSTCFGFLFSLLSGWCAWTNWWVIADRTFDATHALFHGADPWPHLFTHDEPDARDAEQSRAFRGSVLFAALSGAFILVTVYLVHIHLS